MRLAGDPVALLCAGSGSRGDRQLPPHIRSDSRFLLQQCTFEYHEGSKNNRSTITPRYPEAENPFGAQLERVKSIRHFLGRQAANNPGLCNSEESLPMCFPETPPCQSRKVSSGSVMEKHAAKCPWEGGSKKVAFGSSGKYSFVKSMDCFGLGLRGNKQACKEGDLCCTTKTFGHALYPEARLGQEWKLRVWEFMAPCLLSDRSLHLFTFSGIKIGDTKKEPQYSNWESHPSLTLKAEHLISFVHGTRQQTVL